MKHSSLWAAVGLAILLAPSRALPTDREADRRAIAAVIDQWSVGWQTKDAKLAAAGYADDADWTNAFGFYKQGRPAIESFLGEVFELQFVMGASSKVADQEIRFLSDEVATVRTRVERAGQTTPDGQSLGTRHTHHLRVFTKRGGQWVIASHLISDARDPRSPQH